MKNFLLLLFIFLSAGLWAQNPQDDPHTMDVFRAACAQVAEHSIITGNFEQEKTVNRRSKPLASSGNFIVAVGQGMVWDTAEPVPSTLVLGTDYIIQSRPGGKKNVVNARGNDMFIRMAQVMDAVFSGNDQELLDNFEVKFSSGEADNAVWEMGLIPKDKTISSFIEKIIVKGDTVIKIMEMYDKNGGMVRYILSNHQFPAGLGANEKSFFIIP